MEPRKNEHNEPEYAFVKERIIVERPARKAGFFKKFFTTLFLGIVFGGVSAVAFVVALPYLQEYFSHQEPPDNSSERVSIPLDYETTGENTGGETQTAVTDALMGTTSVISEPVTDSDNLLPTEVEQPVITEAVIRKLIAEAMEQKEITLEDYKQLFKQLGSVVNKVNRSIVTVTVSNMVVDILEHSYEVSDAVSGIIYSITDTDIYIMTVYDKIKAAENIKVTFFGGFECDASILRADDSSGMAVICISREALNSSVLNKIQAVVLGNSYEVKAGEPVIAVGDPMGYMYTMSYGIVTANMSNSFKSTDAHYRIINTDIVKNSAGSGFLVNLEGELVGVLMPGDGQADSIMTTDICAAVNISEVKKRLEIISNDESVPYFGIVGEDLPGDEEIPQGIYILQTITDSPAYNAGILNGDIIVGMEDMDNMSMKSFRNFLETSAVGDKVVVTVMRKGKDEYKEMAFEVILGEK